MTKMMPRVSLKTGRILLKKIRTTNHSIVLTYQKRRPNTKSFRMREAVTTTMSFQMIRENTKEESRHQLFRRSNNQMRRKRHLGRCWLK